MVFTPDMHTELPYSSPTLGVHGQHHTPLSPVKAAQATKLALACAVQHCKGWATSSSI